MTMTMDTVEKKAIERTGFQMYEKLGSLHEYFQSTVTPENGIFSALDDTTVNDNIKQSFELGDIAVTPEVSAMAVDTVKDMYHGVKLHGHSSLGLKEINGWKINDNHREANLNQHAGYAAEVISTGRENLRAKVCGTGVVTYRADDMPTELLEKFDGKISSKNDQYVDKVRIKPDGTIETVQTKFVGKDAKSCLKTLTSKKYRKYLEEGRVDKIEIPKEYYTNVKKGLSDKRKALSRQYAAISGDTTKIEQAASIKERINDINRLDKKLEQSCVSKSEAKLAVEHPKLFSAKQIHQEGFRQGTQAAALTAVVSGVQNYYKYQSGEITGKEAIENVVEDSAIEAGIAYGTEVVTQLAGKSSVPGAVIAMGVESYEDVRDYAEGEITETELAYHLGENAAGVIGGMAGAAIGTVAGPVGNITGGVAGAAVATEIYHATTEIIDESVKDVKDFAEGEITGTELTYNLGENVFEAVGGTIRGEEGREIGKAVYETAVETVTENIDTTATIAVEVGESVKETAMYIVDNADEKLTNIAENLRLPIKQQNI